MALLPSLRNFDTRLRGWLTRLAHRWIPYQGRYRPRGLHPESRRLAQQQPDTARYYPLEPATVSRLTIPPDFYAHAPVYGQGLHGKPRAQELLPEAFVLTLPEGRVYAESSNCVAIVGADNYLVGDVSFQYSSRQWTTLPPAHNALLRQRWFASPHRIDGTVCSLLAGGGAASGNYYHWLVDTLPRLELVRRAGLLDQVDYFLVYNPALSFVRESMQTLGIGPERLLALPPGQPHLQARTLVVTSPVRGLAATHTPAWACAFLRRTFTANLPPQPSSRFSRRVYVSRRDAPGRHVLNEAALEQVLTVAGFQTYVLSELSLADKVHLFAGAEVIISPVGAGLCNVAFCAPGTRLLELLPQDFAVADYLEFSARLGLQYHYLRCPAPQRARTRWEAQAQHLIVPLEEVERFLSAEASLFPGPAR